MRCATLIVASLFAMPLLGRVAAVSMAEEADIGTACSATSLAGLAVAICYSLGGLFALGTPRPATVLFIAVALLGTVASPRTAIDDPVVWVVLALALATTGLTGTREQPRSAHTGSDGQ